jgi:hypothetical protein
MASLPREEVTQLLLAWRQGEPLALEELIPVVHKELRRLAHRYMSGERVRVTQGVFTYVAVDRDGRPIPVRPST